MDNRTFLERLLDRAIGLPLYYCDNCRRPAKVVNGTIVRKCACDGIVRAPRVAILHGTDAPTWKYDFRVWRMQWLAKLTQRCIGFHTHAPNAGGMSAGLVGGSSFGAAP